MNISVVPTAAALSLLHNSRMNALVALMFIFGVAVTLLLGLLSIMQSLAGASVHDEPTFRELGPIFHDQYVEPQAARSQFVGRSRPHFRARD
jgi:hypothetical protein